MSVYEGKLAGYKFRGGTAPTDGQAWVWDATNKYWKPGSAGAPTAATYITTTAHASLSAEVLLSSLGFHFLGLTGVKFPTAFGSNLATGDTTLYTAPASKRALVFGYNVYNTSGGNITWSLNASISGTKYRLTPDATTTTGAATDDSNTPFFVLEPAELLVITTATNSGLNAWARIIEYDSSVNLFSARKLAPANGDNTVYTVTAAKTGLVLGSPNTGGPLLNNANGTLGSLNVTSYIVPSGGAAGATNQFRALVAVAAGAVGQQQVKASMAAGDFIVANWSGANAAPGISWITVAET